MIPIVTDCSNTDLVEILLQHGGIFLPGWQNPGLGARIFVLVQNELLEHVSPGDKASPSNLDYYFLTEKGRALFIHVGVELPPRYPCRDQRGERFMYDPIHAEAREIL